jgi:hypothetical protein
MFVAALEVPNQREASVHCIRDLHPITEHVGLKKVCYPCAI